jgi:hypothetical protein
MARCNPIKNMRYFSQNSITRSTFGLIEHYIRSKSSHITLHYPNNRVHTITPVLVLSVNQNMFHCHFMSNPYYRLDLDVLDGSLFTYIYNSDGSPIKTREGVAQYTATCYEYTLHDIYMPKVLEAGDILLCGNIFPMRKSADSEPVLV